MELLANVYDPKIPLSVLMLQLGFKPAARRRTDPCAVGRPIQFELPPNAIEAHEELERWDGLS